MPPLLYFYRFGDVGWNSLDMTQATSWLDRLRGDGVTLERFYSAPQCTPSRAQLLTGRYSMRYGLQDSVIHGTEPRGLQLTQTILPESLASMGYMIYGVGKWHLGFYR